MILPGLIAVTMIAVGLVFRAFGVGAEAVAAFLMVGTIAGILVATFLNNSGGAWDNAKNISKPALMAVRDRNRIKPRWSETR